MRPVRTEYDRRLGLFDGTMLVIGGIIGAGIFLNPAIVAARTGSALGTLAVWGIGSWGAAEPIARETVTAGSPIRPVTSSLYADFGEEQL